MQKEDKIIYGMLAGAVLTIGFIIHESVELVRYLRNQETKVYEGTVVKRRLDEKQFTFVVDTPSGERTFHLCRDETLDEKIQKGSSIRVEVPGRKGTDPTEMYISPEYVRN